MQNKTVIGITMGDPAGIGAEVIAKAIRRLKMPGVQLLLIGDRFIFSKFIRNLPKNCKILDLNNVPKRNFCFGKKSSFYGKAAIEYLNLATSLIKSKEIDALVTAPINKEAVSLAGFKWPGHTEYLAAKFKKKHFVMMFVCDKLRVSLVTRHIPLERVSLSLTIENIFQTISVSYKYLKKIFKIKNPKIAVCGLNPHAGERGRLGYEEDSVIIPAIRKANSCFKNISGPYPADTLFYEPIRKRFDCIICMYHDQAMIPVKTLCLEKSVNLTLGLPFIRTSPAHGTAFDIAGKNMANEGSMVEAIKLAYKLTTNIAKNNI